MNKFLSKDITKKTIKIKISFFLFILSIGYAIASKATQTSEDITPIIPIYYGSLHSSGPWWHNTDLQKPHHQHYAIIKSPGSIYDTFSYLIEVGVSDTFNFPPKYRIRVHYSVTNTETAHSFSKTIKGMTAPLTQEEFDGFVKALSPKTFIEASKNPEDGITTSHLDIFAYDFITGEKREVFSVGWEGFDRFGDAAYLPNVFYDLAHQKFPSLKQIGNFPDPLKNYEKNLPNQNIQTKLTQLFCHPFRAHFKFCF